MARPFTPARPHFISALGVSLEHLEDRFRQCEMRVQHVPEVQRWACSSSCCSHHGIEFVGDYPTACLTRHTTVREGRHSSAFASRANWRAARYLWLLADVEDGVSEWAMWLRKEFVFGSGHRGLAPLAIFLLICYWPVGPACVNPCYPFTSAYSHRLTAHLASYDHEWLIWPTFPSLPERSGVGLGKAAKGVIQESMRQTTLTGWPPPTPNK